MRQMAFVAVVLLTAAAASGQAWEGDLLGMKTGEVHGMVGVTWDSEWLWRGFAPYDNKSATHLMADINLFETGFGMSAVMHRANSSGFENWERLDYTFYYQNGMFLGEPYATNYRFGWVYYNYPDHSPDWYDLQEAQAVFSWPNLLPVKGLCPSYAMIKLWPSSSSDDGSFIGSRRAHGTASGWLHILMLDYGFTVPGVLADIPEHLIKLHAEMVYVHPGGLLSDDHGRQCQSRFRRTLGQPGSEVLLLRLFRNDHQPADLGRLFLCPRRFQQTYAPGNR